MTTERDKTGKFITPAGDFFGRQLRGRAFATGLPAGRRGREMPIPTNSRGAGPGLVDTTPTPVPSVAPPSAPGGSNEQIPSYSGGPQGAPVPEGENWGETMRRRAGF